MKFPVFPASMNRSAGPRRICGDLRPFPDAQIQAPQAASRPRGTRRNETSGVRRGNYRRWGEQSNAFQKQGREWHV